MHKIKTAIVCVLIAIIVPACISASAYFGKITPRQEQILHYSNAAEPRSLDPHKTSGIPEGNIIMSLIDRLTDYDAKTLEPRPAIAERWEAVDKAKKWIFYLRKNVFWTNKRPVTAHDFVWAWQRGIDPKTATPYAGLLYYVKNGEAISQGKMAPTELGIKAIDDYTLEVEMERPTAFFIKMTPHFVFSPLPRETVEKYGDKWATPENIVSCGAFKLAEHKPYDKVLLVKNPDYWDAANVKLDKAYFYPIDDNPTNVNLYKAGELDVIQSGGIPLSFIKTLRKKKDYVGGAFFTTCYYSLNIKRKPLDDVRVRRALNMAIDKASITDKLIAKGDLPATSLVPPGLSGYPKVNGDSYNTQQAKKLMAEAGFPDGKGFPTITIYFNTLEANRQIAEAIQRMWKETLGISAELQNEEWQTFTARRERREFDIARESWTGDYLDPDTFLNLFANDNPNNHSGWINEEYKNLLQEANQEPDEVKRNEMLAKVEKILLDEAVIIPIYFYALSYMQKPYVDGWYPNLFDIHPLKSVSINTNWQPEDNLSKK
ncbi:MAG: peptide ABC transporter substrate-binding protein [Acidobacteria bacterium]|nr:peptide ABC transporter substrate-binding protein [Acidobacteriota bacterium]